jgi:hypothetical protein
MFGDVLTPANDTVIYRTMADEGKMKQELDPERQAYSVAALAKIAGVPRGRMYEMAATGKIKVLRTSGGLVVMRDEVERVLKSMTKVKDVKGHTRIVFEELV